MPGFQNSSKSSYTCTHTRLQSHNLSAGSACGVIRLILICFVCTDPFESPPQSYSFMGMTTPSPVNGKISQMMLARMPFVISSHFNESHPTKLKSWRALNYSPLSVIASFISVSGRKIYLYMLFNLISEDKYIYKYHQKLLMLNKEYLNGIVIFLFLQKNGFRVSLIRCRGRSFSSKSLLLV